METMRSLRQQHTGVTPRFSFDDPYLVLALHRTAESAASEIGGVNIDRVLNADERRGWDYLLRVRETTRRDYAADLGVPARTASRHLAHFVELGLARRVGSARSTKYQVAED